MNLMFFSKREGRARQLNLAHPLALGIAAGCVIYYDLSRRGWSAVVD